MFVIFAVIIFSNFQLIYYLPTLPAIAQQLSVSKSAVQGVVPFMLFGTAVSYFLSGELSENIGSVVTLRCLLPFFIVGGMLVFFVKNIGMLYVGFFFQGCSQSWMISYRYMTDKFKKESMRYMSFINLISIALSPVLTALSGYATDKVGFTYVYLWMSLLCACLFLLLFLLLSDANGRLRDFSVKKLFSHVVILMREPLYSKSVLVCGSIGSCVYVFYMLTPYIVINDYGLSTRYYGTLLSIPFIGKALGALVIGLVEDHFTPDTLIKISLMICLMGAILGVSIFTYYPSVLVLFFCFAIINMGISIAKIN